MNPGVFVMGGGGAGGGSGGKAGKANGGGQGANGDNGGEDAEGDGSGAGACGQGTGGGCPNGHGNGTTAAGDPVDVVTGRVFTVPVADVRLPGPLPLSIARVYSSKASHRDVGLGWGWSHSLAWEIEQRRRSLIVWKHDGTAVHFEKASDGTGLRSYAGPDGWMLFELRRQPHSESAAGESFRLDLNGEHWLHFEPSGERRFRLRAITDAHGNEIALVYDGQQLVEIIDCVGRKVRVRRGSDGRIRAFEVKNAGSQGQWIALSRYDHDERGDLVAARDADGRATTYTYDDDHLLTSHTSAVGLRFHFRYDAEDRCIETWGAYLDRADPALMEDAPPTLADGTTPARGIHHCKIDFFPDHYTEVTDSLAVHRFFGNKFGKVDKAVVAGAVHERQYDEHGHVIAYTDPLGATIRWQRDERGRELTVTDPLGRHVTYDRDRDGHVRCIIDPEGGITEITRAPGMLAWKDPIGAFFQISYDHRGLPVATTAPNGAQTRYAYDAHGNLIEKTSADGAVTRFRYDYLGRCLAAVDPDGRERTVTLSTGGKVLAIHDSAGGTRRFEYDGAGRLTARTDEDGRTTRFAYGGLDKLCAIHETDGRHVALRYDREGRLVDVRNGAGMVHRMERDLAGRVVAERTTDGRMLRYRYDLVGRLIEYENGLGERTVFERDEAGQLTARIYSDGTSDTFEYDLHGNMIAARSADAEVLMRYNAVGWLIRETQIVHGRKESVDITYDVMGNPVRRETTQGHSLSWRRNAVGLADEIVIDDRERVRLGFDVLGRETSRLLPGGGRIATSYDGHGRLVQVSAHFRRATPVASDDEPEWLGPRDPNTSAATSFRYSSAGELTEIWDRAHGITAFEYDGAGHLLSMLPADAPREVFSYDAGGRLTERDDPRRYDAQGRLAAMGDRQLGWDDEGRLVSAQFRGAAGEPQVDRFLWTCRGLLQRVERHDGTVVRFGYDAFARRVFKQVSKAKAPSTYTRFVWDGNALVHELKVAAAEAGDAIVEERTYWFDAHGVEPLAHAEASGGADRSWFHYMSDDLGRPLRVVDAEGEVACEVRYHAWGAATVEGSATSTPFRIAGQYFDDETGLCYNRHRYYDPSSGRFISPDPEGVFGGLDPYAYAANRPTSMIDPDGRMPFTVIKMTDGTEVTGASPSSMRPGTSQHAADSAVPRQQGNSCSEPDALNAMAAHIRSRPGNEGMSDADVQAEIRREFRNGAKMTTREGTPDNPGRIIPPCPTCEALLTDMNLHPNNLRQDPDGTPFIGPIGGGVIAPNRAADTSGSHWNGDYGYRQDREDNRNSGGGRGRGRGGGRGGRGGRRR